MSTYLAAPLGGPPPPPPPPGEDTSTWTLALESLNASSRIVLDGEMGWTQMPGSTGLEMPPVSVATSPIPGGYGSALDEARVEERPIFVPIFIGPSPTQVSHLEAMDRLRSIVDPLTGMFRLIGITDRGARELVAIYTGGLEGSDGQDAQGLYWRKLGLTALACDPFAYDRVPRLVTFGNLAADAPFIGVVGGTDAPWPASLSSSVVIGSGMRISVGSEVPVYPTLDLVGPMTSFTGTMSTGWSVSVPGGVAAGQTLRLVTDPRARSIRLGTTVPDPALFTGSPAAGSVARGSTLRPFYPGVNVLDVVAPGGTSATEIRLSWREAHRSLW